MSQAHSQREHSSLGGSKASIWVNCPGSVQLLKTLPPEETSDAAKEGTVCHEVVEIFLANFLDQKIYGPSENYLQTRHQVVTRSDVDEDMIAAADGFVEFLWKAVLEESIGSKAYGIEEEFSFSNSLNSYGFIDFWCVYIDDRGRRTGVVCDFKYGAVHVGADSDQLKFYAAAMLQEFREMGKDLDRVRCIIYQPRDMSDAIAGRECEYTAKQLDTWTKKAIKAATEALSAKAKYKTGDWCTYCKAQAKCPAYAKELHAKTALKLTSIDTEDLPAPETVPLENVIKIANYGEKIIEYVKSCKKHIIALALNGQETPGIKVVEGATKRKWFDNQSEIIKGLIQIGIPEDALYTKKLIGIGDTQKEIMKLKYSKIQAETMIEPYCSRTQAALLIVPENDPRQKIKGVADKLTALPTKNKE